MTKTINITAATTIAVLLAGIFAASVYADARDVASRDRGTTDRTVESAPLPPTSAPSPQPPAPAGGGISSFTNGVADSGGNSGGVVVTGDEQTAVFEINIGPTNQTPPPQDDGEEVAPAPECDRRSPSGCPTSNPDRTR